MDGHQEHSATTLPSLPRGLISRTNRGTRDDMLTIQALSVVALLAILPTELLSHPGIRIRDAEKSACQPCGDDCDFCEYGVIVSPVCGVPECRKGPDEHCGHNKGICGDGMICMCDKCVGCSLDTLKCSVTSPEHPCLSREARYRNLERSHTFTLV